MQQVAHTPDHLGWALVKRGPGTAGRRPMNRMALLAEVEERDPAGEIISYRAMLSTRNWCGWTRHAVTVPRCDVLKTWDHRPSEVEIERARKALRVEAAS